VPAIAWLSPNSNFSFERTRASQGSEYSHDDLFCTLLAAMDVATEFCIDEPRLMAF
jgi:glucan phosphoethanolaminetransferase (alkaline phosphatase superfamily)